jgi:hypothetical protein
MMVTGTWHSDDAAGDPVQADCRIELNDVATSQTAELGTSADDTGGDQERTVAMNEVDDDLPAGTYEIELSCDEATGDDFDLSSLNTTAVALGS